MLKNIFFYFLIIWGDQLYLAFPFSNDSLDKRSSLVCLDIGEKEGKAKFYKVYTYEKNKKIKK